MIKPEEREFVVDFGASIHIVEQERPELCRFGNRRSLKVRRRLLQPSAKCSSDSVCQRIGFIRDSKASRRYTGRSLTRKTMRRSRMLLPWSETTTHQRLQTHGELRTDRCPWFMDRLFKLSNPTSSSQEAVVHSIPYQQEVRVQVSLREYGETRRVNQKKTKT